MTTYKFKEDVLKEFATSFKYGTTVIHDKIIEMQKDVEDAIWDYVHAKVAGK